MLRKRDPLTFLAADPTDRVLSSSTRLVVPVSAAPVPVDGKVILHLSDLHFAIGERRESQHKWKYPGDTRNVATLAEAVSDSVPADDVAALLVTGDFTFLADCCRYGWLMAFRSGSSMAIDG